MRVLFDNLDTFPNPSALVVIILSKGRHPAAYDNEGNMIPKDEILASFDNERFKTVLPKMVIFHTTVTQPLVYCGTVVPEDCICVNLSSTNDTDNVQLTQLIELFRNSEHTADVEVLLQEVTKRKTGSVISYLNHPFLLPVRNESHQLYT